MEIGQNISFRGYDAKIIDYIQVGDNTWKSGQYFDWDNGEVASENLYQIEFIVTSRDGQAETRREIVSARQLRNYDYTGSERMARRKKILDDKAKSLGFLSLSELLTKWKNGEIIIKVE